MIFATSGLSDLVHSQGKLYGKIGAGDKGVFYDDPEFVIPHMDGRIRPR